jgi:DNA-binding PadR family transcriptional regulator
MDNKIILTDNGKRVLAYLKENDKTFVGKDLGEDLGIKGIYPVLNSLIRNGLVEQGEPVTRDFTNNKGVTSPKDYKTYQLTDAGRAYTVED